VYITWYICLPVHGGHTTRVYIPYYTTLGTPLYTPGPLHRCQHARTDARWRREGALGSEGRNPWVRASLPLRTVNSVMRDRSLCAELLRSPLDKVKKDRIDEGCTLLYYPMVRVCCAEWYPFLCAIRSLLDVRRVCLPLITRFTVG